MVSCSVWGWIDNWFVWIDIGKPRGDISLKCIFYGMKRSPSLALDYRVKGKGLRSDGWILGCLDCWSLIFGACT